MGPKIRPKSTKNGPKRQSSLYASLVLKCYRFWTRFYLQHGLQNRRFFASGAQSWIMRKPYFSLGFYRFFEVRSTGNPLENRSRNEAGFATRFGSVLTRFSDALGVPKRRKNGWESVGFRLRIPVVFRRQWASQQVRPRATGLAGFRRFSAIVMALRLIRSGLLICSSSP